MRLRQLLGFRIPERVDGYVKFLAGEYDAFNERRLFKIFLYILALAFFLSAPFFLKMLLYGQPPVPNL